MPWVKSPHCGGVKIPKPLQERIRRRILAHAQKRYKGRNLRLDVRFRSQYCYIDAYVEPDLPKNWPPRDWGETRAEMIERLRNTPTHLCRLRHFSEDRWSLAFYTYSSDKYVPSVFPSGSFWGTPEEGLDVAAVYLQG